MRKERLGILLGLFAVLVGFLCACSFRDYRREDGQLLPYGVTKFTDGEVTCWLYYQKGISCLQTTQKR